MHVFRRILFSITVTRHRRIHI